MLKRLKMRPYCVHFHEESMHYHVRVESASQKILAQEHGTRNDVCFLFQSCWNICVHLNTHPVPYR